MTSFPIGSTHIERDGTFWKCEKNQWWHWNYYLNKWFPYAGLVNKNFLDLRMPLVGEA